VRVDGARTVGRPDQVAPGCTRVFGDLDPVAGDWSAAVVIGRRPAQVDLRSALRLGSQCRGRRGDGGLGHGSRDVGDRPRAGAVDRVDAVVSRRRGIEAGVGEGGAGRAGVGREIGPADAVVVRDLDAVARHGGAAGAGQGMGEIGFS